MPVRIIQCGACDGNVDDGAQFCPHCGEPVPYAPPEVDPFIGRTVSQRYKVVQRIARGGMGEVYLARHTELNQRVAVKFLHRRFADDEAFVTRFFNEARSACRVDHPNAVTIYDFGRLEDGTVYIVMEFVDGVPLKDLIKRDRRIDPALSVRIAKEVAEVLSAAHEQAIVHRDVKPDNIMVRDHSNGRVTVKMLDFGIAKILDDESGSSLTQTGVTFGTPEYMSPEQAAGRDVDARSDVYALGLVIYAMIVGRPPFQGQNKLALLQRHIREIPTPINVASGLELPVLLVTLVDEMVQKDPKRRPKSMDEVGRRLQEIEDKGFAAFSSRPASQKPPAPAPATAPRPKREPPRQERLLTHNPEPSPEGRGFYIGEEESGRFELGGYDLGSPEPAATDAFSIGSAQVVEEAWSLRDDAVSDRFAIDEDPFAAPLPGRPTRERSRAKGKVMVVVALAAVAALAVGVVKWRQSSDVEQGDPASGELAVGEQESTESARGEHSTAEARANSNGDGDGEVPPPSHGQQPAASAAGAGEAGADRAANDAGSTEPVGGVAEGTLEDAAAAPTPAPTPANDEVAERVSQILGAIESGNLSIAKEVLEALRAEGAGEFQSVVNAANRVEAVEGLVAQIERELVVGECVRADEKVVELQERYSRRLAMTYYGRLDACRAAARAQATAPPAGTGAASAPAPTADASPVAAQEQADRGAGADSEPTPTPTRPRGPVRPPRDL